MSWDPTRYVSVARAAELLRCSDDTVRKLFHQGRLRGIRRGFGQVKQILVERESVEQVAREVVERSTENNPAASASAARAET